MGQSFTQMQVILYHSNRHPFCSSILSQLCQSGLVDLTILHLKVLCCQEEEAAAAAGAANAVCDVMFQMTACLREG